MLHATNIESMKEQQFQVERFNFYLCGRLTINCFGSIGSGFPITIDMTNPDFLPSPEMNTVIITFYSSDDTILSSTTFTFPLPEPGEYLLYSDTL